MGTDGGKSGHADLGDIQGPIYMFPLSDWSNVTVSAHNLQTEQNKCEQEKRSPHVVRMI